MLMVLKGIGPAASGTRNDLAVLNQLQSGLSTRLNLLRSSCIPATPPSAAITVNKIKPSPHPSEAFRSFKETMRRHADSGKWKDFVAQKGNIIQVDEDAGVSFSEEFTRAGDPHQLHV